MYKYLKLTYQLVIFLHKISFITANHIYWYSQSYPSYIFVANFNFSTCESNNVSFTLLYYVIYINISLNLNKLMK